MNKQLIINIIITKKLFNFFFNYSKRQKKQV